MEKVYLIGGHTILIDSLYERVHLDCEKYQTDSAPETEVRISRQDIIWERNRTTEVDVAEGRKPRRSPDDYIETLAVYRKIAEWMPSKDILLFHGSAIAVDGQCYLFAAKSGTGKSTHTRLWKELLGDCAVMVNDDKPLIHINQDGNAVVYGTPWDGKHHLSTNIAVPLKAICILGRSEENYIQRIAKKVAYPMLLQQSYRPMNSQTLQKTLVLIDRLHADYYRMGCNMDISAAELAYNTMKG